MARVVRFARHGGPEVLEIHDEAPAQPGAGELRIAVEAIGLNRAEIMFRSGHYVAAAAFPSRIGLEASGVIDALGPGVFGFAIGDRVAAVPYLSWDEWGNWTTDSVVKYGVYGESAVVPAFTVTRNPDGLSPVQGAAIWCQYATAWGGLIDYAALAPSDIVLVTAASSSAALGGLQIAKRVGATVIAATRKTDKADFLREAGADHVVATEEEDLVRCVKEITGGRGFTVAYDPVGGRFLRALVDAAQPGATIVSYGNLRTEAVDLPILPMLAKRLDIKFHSLFDTVRLPEKRAACAARATMCRWWTRSRGRSGSRRAWSTPGCATARSPTSVRRRSPWSATTSRRPLLPSAPPPNSRCSRTGRIRGGGRWARGRGGRGCLRSARRRPGRGPRRGAGPGSAGPPAGPIR